MKLFTIIVTYTQWQRWLTWGIRRAYKDARYHTYGAHELICDIKLEKNGLDLDVLRTNDKYTLV